MEIEQRLKVVVVTEGLAIDQATRQELVESPDIPITLSDYASTSGPTLRTLQNDVWMNAPISDFNANFVKTPSNRLISDGGQLAIVGELGEHPVEFIPVPKYHDQGLEDGSPVTNIAITHSDRVRLSPIKGCSMTCLFCDIPYDRDGLEPDDPRYRGPKPIPNILEAAGVALQDEVLRAEHILISGGTPAKKHYGYENQVYEQIVAANPGVDVDIMMVPMPGLLDAKRLARIGVHALSINLELFNSDLAKKYMSNKAKASRELYLDFIENAVPEFGPGNVRSMMMVGLESIEDTLRGVKAIAERGSDPVLSAFRPDPKTPLWNHPPPTANHLLEVWQRSQEIVSAYDGVELGPRCIPCMHNTLTFPDGTDTYYHSKQKPINQQAA